MIGTEVAIAVAVLFALCCAGLVVRNVWRARRRREAERQRPRAEARRRKLESGSGR